MTFDIRDWIYECVRGTLMWEECLLVGFAYLSSAVRGGGLLWSDFLTIPSFFELRLSRPQFSEFDICDWVYECVCGVRLALKGERKFFESGRLVSISGL